jgi:hypothetical protein
MATESQAGSERSGFCHFKSKQLLAMIRRRDYGYYPKEGGDEHVP